MSNDFHVQCDGHNSIYINNYQNNNYKKRKFDLYYNIPDLGINFKTGILLIIAGFGGHSNSNVYKKMRNVFSDKYNLITIQCDYFGYEFMQNPQNIRINKKTMKELIKIISLNEIKKKSIIELKKFADDNNISFLLESTHGETLENFADMSYMQAIDNITAVLKVMNILRKDNMDFNTKKVIIYGHSQGAYLSYLCNLMTNNLFTFLLDNSSWEYPLYLSKKESRVLSVNDIMISIYYYCQKLNLDLNDLKISNLYKNFNNKCKIIVYHGNNDELISYNDKLIMLEYVDNVIINLITNDKIDNNIFKSDRHGLDADFLKLFDEFYERYIDNDIGSILKPLKMFKNNNIEIDYSQERPNVVNFKYNEQNI